MIFRGITWDHPRGHDALAAAAGELIRWDTQPLEGFESHPIDDLCARYDLVVLDHPHLGEALATGSLTPLDDLFPADELGAWGAASIGPSMSSYVMAGRQWALPLDAATQVAATRADLAGEAPDTWDDVSRLAGRGPVALSLAGPHAFLSFASIAVALGEEPGSDAGCDGLVSTGTGLAVLDLMAGIDSRAPAETRELNPIGLLELMAGTDRLWHVPLVYGYVTYAGRVAFTDAPTAGGRRGSTLGGTGIAVSARCRPTPELLDHVRWLMSPEAQCRFLPAHSGQPSARAAWADPALDVGGFYSRTAATCEDAWVRPRYAGYIGFQSAASAVVRAVLAGELQPTSGLDRMRALSAASRTGQEQTT